MPKMGHAARIIAHQEAILTNSHHLLKAIEETRASHASHTNEQQLDHLNRKMEGSAPWQYDRGNDENVLAYGSIDHLETETKEIMKGLITLKDAKFGKEEKWLRYTQFAEQFAASCEMAWLLELEKRQESNKGDCMIDADPVTIRLLAVVGLVMARESENDGTDTIFIDEFPMEEAFNLSPRKRKSLARKVVQKIITESGSASHGKMHVGLNDQDGKAVRWVKFNVRSGNVGFEANGGNAKVFALNDKMIFATGEYPETMLQSRLGGSLDKMVSHYVTDGLGLKFISWKKDKREGNPVLRMDHDALRTERMKGLFIIGGEE